MEPIEAKNPAAPGRNEVPGEFRKPPVGIIGAMQEEVAGLCAQMQAVRQTLLGGMCFFEGTLEGRDVVVVQSGVGKVNAAICAMILTGHFRAAPVLNTGIAGSLDNDLNIGDIVLSTDAVQHDVDATVWGYAPGEVPGMGMAAYPAAEELLAQAEQVCKEVNPDIAVRRGRIASGDQFISDPEKKQQIIKTFGASCTEMEGAAIAQVCWRNKAPFLIIRTISDKADGSAVADNTAFTEEVIQRNDKLVRRLMQHL